MKSILTLSFVFLVSTQLFAQSTQSGTLKYNGVNYPCDQIEFNVPPSDAEKIVTERMKAVGFTPEKGKSPVVYRNVVMSDLSFGQPQDLIFSFDRKDRKNPDVTVISLVSARAGEIPTGKVKGAGKGMASITSSQSAPAFLNSFRSEMEVQEYNLTVVSKTDEIKKAEKRLDDLKKEQSKIEKKIKDLESDLQSNIKSQGAQVSEIDTLKQQLEELKANAPVQ